MRILINSLQSLGRKTGIGRYVAELVAALQSQLGADETLDLFPDGWLGSACGWLRNLGGKGGATPARPTWKGWLLQQAGRFGRGFLGARLTARLRQGYDLYHEPNNVPPSVSVPTVVTLHDLSVILHPQWHPASRVAQYERHFRQGLANCAHILTDTRAVRREILAHLGIAPERVTATILGVDPNLRPMSADEIRPYLRALKLPERYLLSVGTLEPRKNQAMLLRAFLRLPEVVRSAYPLVLVGGAGWNVDGLMTDLESARSQGVIRLGYVPDAALPALYSGARALLFPSFYEGFGLPPLEMQACGGAVLASTADAVAEVMAGSPAYLIDPRDEAGWHDAIRRVCLDDAWWHSLRVGAVTAAGRYRWSVCAAQTLQVYRGVALSDSLRRVA